ncbi:neopullulanase [Pseudoalteromonas denitrificans DSM 6059]|uniref:Neopullulanase n=2 Tax=Pseudoalteromonas TaxID=53246 RepID=A0A1I1TQG3_9GAMM|nr:neopullulanase [Pseudoalteromonas denitrificans DSM 6059]
MTYQKILKESKLILKLLSIAIALGLLSSCQNMFNAKKMHIKEDEKPVIYQVFTRLFGNQNTMNKPWGTKSENGVGKFSDFNDKALSEIKALGISHIWYTGVLHHAVIGDYSQYGIKLDDPDIVKGRAGSPYAIKDYYNVNPDLAINPESRLNEFESLIQRTHQHDMKVIIDIVPNHIARNYHSLSNPQGITDFGEFDDTSVEYDKNNNFYYVVGEDFKVPKAVNNYQALSGEKHILSDGTFFESPAKWTGNGSRKAQPNFNDWYETVKVNYGIKPDGSYDFVNLPSGYEHLNYQSHYDFWQKQDLPNSWYKFRDIAYYWLDKGVDGFRYDMAEMVPVEFWSFLNSSIKVKNPEAFILAEVYNPALYRSFIHLGKMDYLYDKVDFYDTLKAIMQGKQGAQTLFTAHQKTADISDHMLHFLENHDEQRIASPEFVGDANKGKPAMVVSSLISKSPTLLYFAQEVGEDGSENAGFGKPSRTSIFDYIGVPAQQRWVNKGKFDGGLLTASEQKLRVFYGDILRMSKKNVFAKGDFSALEVHTKYVNDKESLLAFTRFTENEIYLIINQFDEKNTALEVVVSNQIIKKWQLADGQYSLADQLSGNTNMLLVKNGQGLINLTIPPLGSLVYKMRQHNEK